VICNACKEAPLAESEEARTEMHRLCANEENGREGESWCDCHHRVGPTAQFVQPEAVVLMREHGLPVHE
jgi:hypothetical protein